MTRRTQINKLVTHQGGTYIKNLERPVKVTHLLCSGDEETEKMRYAEKFNKKGEANIFLVWEEWFWDSLEFGGRFEEAKYAVTRPRPERKTIPEGQDCSWFILLPDLNNISSHSASTACTTTRASTFTTPPV